MVIYRSVLLRMRNVSDKRLYKIKTSNTNLIHTSLFTLVRFTVSTCFGHYCPSSGGTTQTQGWWLLCAVVDVGRSQDVGRLSYSHNKVKSEVCIKLVLLITKLRKILLSRPAIGLVTILTELYFLLYSSGRVMYVGQLQILACVQSLTFLYGNSGRQSH
jgi:hypothetical protein